MTIRRFLVFLALAFALVPLALPAVLDESASSASISADHDSPEAAAVLEFVKNLNHR